MPQFERTVGEEATLSLHTAAETVRIAPKACGCGPCDTPYRGTSTQADGVVTLRVPPRQLC